jgi:uncharacterized heparinase superfamily protein
MLDRALRLFRTIRYLRPVQFYGRLKLHFYQPSPRLRPAPVMRRAVGIWKACARPASMMARQRFRFLNVERELTCAADWDNKDWDKLWLYNLHYFNDLNACDATARGPWHREMIVRWMRDNPAGRGIGWEPYCLSVRIVNWCAWSLVGNPFGEQALDSLANQTRYLSRRIEWHLLGNHLLANAKALIFAGAFFFGTEADGWRKTGLHTLRTELHEQILGDGGHIERSPMYHAIVLEDVLDLIQLAAVFPELIGAADIAQWHDVALRMLRWLAVMTHPDGEISFFNDAAFAIAPTYAQLRDYAQSIGIMVPAEPGEPLTVLADSGYVRMSSGPAVVIADIGKIGPDYQPGHAHADTLSFELSLSGKRVLVNAGISRYDFSIERLWQRSTAAHNTVEIDNQNSSEIWSSFRVARRARPLDVRHGVDDDNIWLSAAHDGYARLHGRPIHRRTWRLARDALSVVDEIEGHFDRAFSRFRFHPDWEGNTGIESGQGELKDSQRRVAWSTQGVRHAQCKRSTWHREFGKSIDCTVLKFEIASNAQWLMRWQ